MLHILAVSCARAKSAILLSAQFALYVSNFLQHAQPIQECKAVLSRLGVSASLLMNCSRLSDHNLDDEEESGKVGHAITDARCRVPVSRFDSWKLDRFTEAFHAIEQQKH
jgi:hypothetical protein